MKIFYKLLIDETNTVIGLSSDNVPFKTPGDVVVSEEEIKKYVPFKTTLEMLNHYIVDDNGFCPLYEETAND